MSITSLFPIPQRFAALPEPQRTRELAKYLIRVSALYHMEDGSMRDLSVLCGWNPGSLQVMISRGDIKPRSARKLESVVGRDYLPAELLCPSIAASDKA